MRKNFYLFLIVFTLPATVFATALDDLRAFMKDAQTVRASFTQVTHSKEGKSGQTVEGELSLSRPGKFRWQTKTPYPQLIVGDGDRVWFFDEDLNQVVVRTREEALGGTPAALLAGDADVEKTFDINALPDTPGMSWLLAKPRGGEGGINEIRLGFAEGRLASLELLDAFGQKVITRFTRVDYNVALGSELFTFTPPTGADVIGAVTGKR
ncbi:MAG: outer membrane lipoprotein chaperone LolA [Burkholderiales bacterium]|jgi:outer membrane lipoprotein carrier protein|nr:outer membrane lipoprotein chaperone LolA [Burkholderiales bacterium]